MAGRAKEIDQRPKSTKDTKNEIPLRLCPRGIFFLCSLGALVSLR